MNIYEVTDQLNRLPGECKQVQSLEDRSGGGRGGGGWWILKYIIDASEGGGGGGI